MVSLWKLSLWVCYGILCIVPYALVSALRAKRALIGLCVKSLIMTRMLLHESACWCMRVHENAWECMLLYESAWECMRVHESAWECMLVYESAWECMLLHESACCCMRVHENAWECMRVHVSVKPKDVPILTGAQITWHPPTWRYGLTKYQWWEAYSR